MKRKLGIIVGATLLVLLVVSEDGYSQVTDATVRVDGLSCPFCAYSLEKQLKKVNGTGDVVIEVNDGIAALTARDGQSIGVEQLEEAVGKAGFTPRGITITVVGHLEEMAGYPALHVPVADITLILKKNKQFDRLKKAVGDKSKEIKIRGKIYQDETEGHTGHPYNLTIETYEIIGSS